MDRREYLLFEEQVDVRETEVQWNRASLEGSSRPERRSRQCDGLNLTARDVGYDFGSASDSCLLEVYPDIIRVWPLEYLRAGAVCQGTPPVACVDVFRANREETSTLTDLLRYPAVVLCLGLLPGKSCGSVRCETCCSEGNVWSNPRNLWCLELRTMFTTCMHKGSQ